MKPVTRNDLKKIFKKVKHLRLPQDLEQKDFNQLKYLGWLDESDHVCYLVYEYKGKLEGLRLDFLRSSFRPLQRGFCEFCHKHRRKDETLLVTTETKKLPKKINYRVRGTYICSDFSRCNFDMKDDKQVEKFFYQILEED